LLPKLLSCRGIELLVAGGPRNGISAILTDCGNRRGRIHFKSASEVSVGQGLGGTRHPSPAFIASNMRFSASGGSKSNRLCPSRGTKDPREKLRARAKSSTLMRRGSGKLAPSRAGGPIRVGLRKCNFLYASFDADLPALRLPVECERP